MRTAQQVLRINERFTGPFLGLSEHNEPEMIGPTRCEDCNNILMIDGRIQQRFGLTLSGIAISNVKPHAIRFFSQRDSSVIADPVTYTALGVILAENTSTSVWNFYRKPVGSNWTKITGDLQGGAGRLVLSGLLGRGNTLQSIPAYNVAAYGLDGGDQMFKSPLNADFIVPIGIGAPTTVAVATSGSTFSNFPSNCRFAVSFCDRLQAPIGSTLQHPGQEGNSAQGGAIQDMNAKNLDFRAPTNDGWTHARLYVNFTGDPTFKLIGNFPKHADFAETGDYETLELISAQQIRYRIFHDYTAFETTLLPEAGHQVTTSGAFDFRPSRNLVPQNMHYFAMYKARSFWANKHDTIVFYSDAISPLTGGHPEALGGEFLDGFDGPITLLSEYNDALIIGTPTSMWRLTGTLSSHTNATAETSATIAALPVNLVRVPVESGPMAGGVGNHVTIDNILYFISDRGLEAFDGATTLDLSRAIREHPDYAGSDFSIASLAMDYKNGLLYVCAPPDIWVYHFRLRDPDTGVGTWTFWDKADRSHDFQCITNFDGLSPNVIMGSYDTSGTEGRMDSLPSVLETSSESRPWSWLSGDIDLGVPDRRKRWFTLTVHGKDDVTSGARVSYSIDGGSFVVAAADFNTLTTRKFHINGYGRRLRVRFDGLTGDLGNTRILGYDVEAELIDWF